MENKKVFKEVNNYTKYKLVMMLIEKYKDKKIDNINLIEELSDDILKVLAVAGMKYPVLQIQLKKHIHNMRIKYLNLIRGIGKIGYHFGQRKEQNNMSLKKTI